VCIVSVIVYMHSNRRILQFYIKCYVSALLLDDTLLKCAVSTVAFKHWYFTR